MVGRVMQGARAWIEEIGRLNSLGMSTVPDLQFMAKGILRLIGDPALRAGYVTDI
jgi:hypothetical protein